jgi:hypothetical protein
MILSKLSIGVFLLRVTVQRVHKWIIYFMMVLTGFTGTVFFFVTVFQCTPISFFCGFLFSLSQINMLTMPSLSGNRNQSGYCVPMEIIIALTFLYSACAIISDFTFAILPIFLIWGLNMPSKTRLMLIPVLGMACM